MSFEPKIIKKAEKSKFTKNWLGLTLAFALAFGAFFSGLQIGSEKMSVEQSASVFNFFTRETVTEKPSNQPNLDEFWKVWKILDEKFVTSSSTKIHSEEDRVQGAINGLVDSYGDPYTVYLPPAETSAFDENISGNFSGVGMEVGQRENMITVIAPLPETPAEQAGVITGDIIVRIDDTPTDGMRIDEAVKLIRGEKGTVVTLQVYRYGETELLTIPITRNTINIPTVKTDLVENTFIIYLYSFNAVAEALVAEAIEEYVRSGAETLIIDVRGNPGGFLQSSVSIASYFLPAGKVVVKEEFGGVERNEVFRSRGRQVKLFNPNNLVVLVDNGSASASEILAGALQDHAVATVIGTQTFGKGSVQELVKLDNNSSLKVTIARWLTPNGTSISDGGLTPDIVISRTPAHRIADEDPQKEAAIRFLKGEVVVSEETENILTKNLGGNE